MEKEKAEKLSAELSALYEISSLLLIEDLERLLEEAKEKAIRILGLSHYALLLHDPERGEIFCSWGFKGLEEIAPFLEGHEGSRAMVFSLGRNGLSGQLVVGKDRPLEPEERRLLSLFALYLEKVLLHLWDIRRFCSTEERLRAEMEFARGIIAAVPDCILVLDRRMRVKGANEGFFRTFAKDPEEVVGRSLAEVLNGGEETLKVLFLKNRCYGTGFEVTFDTAQGRRIFKVLPVPLAQGGEGHEMLLFRDITEERETQRILSRYHDSVRQAFLGTAHALSKVIEQRDPYTSGHCEGVARLSQAIGAELGLPEDRLTGLYVCGILHDIGKLSVPAEILVKPGKLSDLEMELIKTHPMAGYQILKDIDFPWEVAKVALQHHERIDGSGYPKGLKGDEIVPEARIVAVADVVDAKTHNRPYRPALGMDEALKEIERNKGVKYDPEVVEACLRVLGKGGW